MSNDNFEIDTTLQVQINQARQAGEILGGMESRAVKAWYEIPSERIFIEIQNGVVMGFPYKLLQGLESAGAEQLTEVEVTPSGYGLHWRSLDVDLGVPQLVAGIFGTKNWMTELGRLGGQAKSAAKVRASQENGKRGGRPRKDRTSVGREEGWAVKKAHPERVSGVFETQRDAELRAKDIVSNLGSGEVHIHGRDGRRRDSDTVVPRNKPSSSRVKKH
jgi:hypothetical protein